VVLLLLGPVLVFASIQTSVPQDVPSVLVRAEKLYYDAQFEETIRMLSPLDTTLRSQPAPQDEKIQAKLLLALAYIGKNEKVKAKSLFKEVSALDANFFLSSEKYSSDVLALFEEAMAENRDTACRQICERANNSLDAQDIPAVLKLLETSHDTCMCLTAAAMDAAEFTYTEGVKSYDENDFPDALIKFHTALKLRPNHELARRYVDFTEEKIRLAADAAVLEWRKNIDGRQFALAAAKYRQIKGGNLEGVANAQLHEIQVGYRDLLSQSIESWKQACEDGNSPAMRNLWTKVMEIVADRDLAEEFLDEMKCPTKFCMWADSAAVMDHLNNRVDPVISPDLRRVVEKSAPTTVYAHVRIDEAGNVDVLETQGIHPGIREAVRIAVGQWKFSAPNNDNAQDCVEAIVPVVIPR